ncbi:hypothetical protein HFO30_36085 [Rhizobium laguerreae]|nr:hypothetical protein [Rhizobium laguerreae]
MRFEIIRRTATDSHVMTRIWIDSIRESTSLSNWGEAGPHDPPPAGPYGVTAKIAARWVEWFLCGGPAGTGNCSSRPKTSPRRTSERTAGKLRRCASPLGGNRQQEFNLTNVEP